MPVYNTGEYLEQAIKSILEGSYTNIELIAIDDGSTDGSGAILDQYQKRDPRLRVVHQKNSGVVAAANHGISLARGEYIARQDSDDVSFPRRIERQIAILQAHPSVELVTGVFEGMDEDGEFIYRDVLPADDEDIKRAMFLRNPIGHGSTMMRTQTLRSTGAYGVNGDTRGVAEDFELFIRLARIGTFQAIEYATYRWRINFKGITQTQNKLMAEVMKNHIDALWADTCPPVFGTGRLRQKGNHYLHTYKRRGVGMKQVMLADNAQIGIKMIRYGHPLRGVRQLLAVLFVGRSGIRAIHQRFRHLRRGTTAALRRKLWLSK